MSEIQKIEEREKEHSIRWGVIRMLCDLGVVSTSEYVHARNRASFINRYARSTGTSPG